MCVTWSRDHTAKVIEKFYNWADANHMAINRKKSQIIQLKFSKHKKHKSTIGSINGLKLVQQYKYLGVDFDETLSF